VIPPRHSTQVFARQKLPLARDAGRSLANKPGKPEQREDAIATSIWARRGAAIAPRDDDSN